MKQYTGMRKGISLIEMMIAVILFAALASIGLKYSKQYINTDLQAMKARVAAAMDQAKQLADAYKLYKLEYGEITATTDLNSTSSLIMTSLPVQITEMTNDTTPWDFNSSLSTTYTTAKGFMLTLDANKTATADEQYCKLWNREFNASITELNVSDNEDMGSVDGFLAAGYKNFCAGSGGSYTIYVTLP